MNNKSFRTLFALLISSLFLVSVAFANPPADDGDGDYTNTGTDVGDTGADDPADDGNQLLDDDIEAREEADRTYGNDADHRSEAGTTILEEADIEAGDNDCTEEFGSTVTVRAERTNGSWPGVDTYRMNVVQNEDGSISCEPEWVRYDRVNSCFDPETKILMSDKSFKPIKDILAGDVVWNPVLNKAQEVTHVLVGPEKVPMIQVGYGDTSMKITQTHPMVVLRDEGFKNIALSDSSTLKSKVVRASELQLNDRILGADGQFHKIEILRELPVDPEQLVYNFEVKVESDEITEHMIVAEGFITGDVRVQANLNDYTLPWDKK